MESLLSARAPLEAPLKVLLIEDDENDALLFREILRAAGRPFEIVHAGSMEAATHSKAKLPRTAPEIVATSVVSTWAIVTADSCGTRPVD